MLRFVICASLLSVVMSVEWYWPKSFPKPKLPKGMQLAPNQVAIPHNIHFIWMQKNLLTEPLTSQTERDNAKNVRAIADMNPEYDVHFYDDAACQRECRQTGIEGVPELFEDMRGATSFGPSPWANMANVCRLAMLYNHGGLYMDTNMAMRMPFKAWLREDVSFVAPMSACKYKRDFFNSLLGASPGHNAIRFALERMVRDWDGHTFLGLKTYYTQKEKHNTFCHNQMGTIYSFLGWNATNREHTQMLDERIHFKNTFNDVPRRSLLENKWYTLCNTIVVDPESGLVPFYSHMLERANCTMEKSRAREPLTPVVEYAKSMQRRNGFVYVQFLNEAFVPMTLNWLCHTDAKVVLKTLFIATDEAAERALRKVVKHVVFLPFASGELSYGQRTYYDYMLFRTRTLSALLQSDVSVWLIESDATWFGNPEPHLPRGYDIVVGQDGYFHEDIPEAGFVFLNATEKTKRMWQSLSEQQAAALQDAGSGWLGGKGSEMLMLPGQIVKHGLRRGDFPRAFFVGGKWYQNATFRDMVNPVVIQNNWIIGNGPKIKRAQQWGHWYLNQSNECPSLTDHVVFTTFKPNASGQRRQIESNFLKNVRQLNVRSVVFTDDKVDTNVHGTPVLGKMYTRVFEMYPHAKTYTFVNGDILFNNSFVEAADALYNMTTMGTLNRRFLAVGTRTNVDWTSEITPANFSSAFASGFLATPQSSDFFMVTRETFDWEKEIPPFVIGRPSYDNWLMHYAQTLSEVELVDVTRAVPSLHMTSKLGNREHAVSPKPDQRYNFENMRWTEGFSTGRGYYQTFEGETLSARLRLVRPYALQVKHAHTAGIWYNGTQSLDTYRKWTKQGFDCYLLVRVMLKSWSLTIDGERFNARYYSPQLGGLSYVVVPSTLYEEVHKNSQANLFRYEVNVPTTFEIIVLTMNRAKSVMRLLKSLEASEYGSEQIQLTIHVDYRAGNQDTVDIVNNYSWPHGSKRVVVRRANIGLMRAWLNAWSGKSDRFIIFEDDITVSPKWYTWLQRAWDQYESRTDMAGISIMRQTLIPKLPDWGFWREIVNGHAPFLYKLMGSIGFSPHPTRWREFLDWMAQLKDDFDPSVPGLITTHWWQHHPKGSMWEAHFIYKNIQDGLYTMYVNLPKGETLAANMREQGEHYTSTEGADFPLATEVAYHFPKQLQKYDWDGSKEIRPTIAVAIPCIAEDLKELPALKKSIEQQTSPPDEIVLVVSNTTSCPSFDGWTIVCRKEQLLSGLARNLAWETASSDIISFVDADDEMYPERISLIRSYFEKQPKLQMLLHDNARHPILKHKQIKYPVASIDGHAIYKAADATPHLKHLPIAGITHGHVTIRRDIPCTKFPHMKRFQDSVFVRECVYKLGDDADSMSALQVPLTRYIERAERIVNKFKSPFGGGGGLNQKEMILLTRKYGESSSVFEWGIGDSSLLASLAHVNRLVGVDSAVVWVKQVQKHTPSRFDIRHINIGPVGGWGYPEDDSRKPNWPDYSTAPRQDQPFDFYFVDGRFRVACMCQALLHGHSKSRVVLHDFRQNRPYYRVILDVADVVEQVDSLVVFKRKPGATDKMIMHMWETHKYDKR